MPNLYYANKIASDSEETFDYISKELFYFFIPHHKVFKNVGFCFNPAYEVNLISYENQLLEVEIKKKDNFVDLFEKENVNVKVICGKNGCGKTTLLRLMEGRAGSNADDCIYIFKDKEGRFASSVKTKISGDNIFELTKYGSNIVLQNICAVDRNISDEHHNFTRKIVPHYFDHKKLYDGNLSENLFTHFKIKKWDLSQNIDSIIAVNAQRCPEVFTEDEQAELKRQLKNDFFLYYFFYIFQDSIYDDYIVNILSDFKELYGNHLTDYLYSFLLSRPVAIQKEIDELFNLYFSLDDESGFIQANDKLYALEAKIKETLKKCIDEDIPEITIHELIYFDGINKKLNRTLTELSSGEFYLVKYKFDIAHALVNQETVWWYIDEPETSLHPEWCRNFMHIYFKAYNEYKSTMNDFNRRVTIVFATHSPFLLSDISNDYIIYLEKQKNDSDDKFYTKEIKTDISPFMGNIGELITSNLFMESSMGERSKNIVKEILENLKTQTDLPKDELEKYKKLFGKVGDELLRKLLLEKLERYEKN